MVDIHLTCRLSRDIDENFSKFPIDINIDDTVDLLEDKIYQEVTKKNGDIFSNIKANQLELWKVQIRDDEFPKLVLKDDETNYKEKLRGKIINYWEKQPDTEYTHVIVDSPFLELIKEKDSEIEQLNERINRLLVGQSTEDKSDENTNTKKDVITNEDNENNEDYTPPNMDRTNQVDQDEYSYPIPNRWGNADKKLQDLCSAGIIRVNSELYIKKKYYSTWVEIRCRVNSIDNGKLFITIIGSTGPEWMTHLEILTQGDPDILVPEDGKTSPFDFYENDQVEEIFGGKNSKKFLTCLSWRDYYLIYVKSLKMIDLLTITIPKKI